MVMDGLYDPDAEGRCVGWLLARPNHWHHVTETLTPEDFDHPAAREAYALLLHHGYLTVQALAAFDPKFIDARDLNEWATTARDELNDRLIAVVVARVANLSVRRRVHGDAHATIADALDPTIDEVELVTRVRERADQAEAPEGKPDEPAVPVDQFLDGDDGPHDWIIDDMLERRERMLVTATGGVGKSTMLRQFAAAVAAGRHPFTAKRLENGPRRVLLLDLENSRRQVRRKIRPIVEALGDDLDPKNLLVVANPAVVDVTTAAGWRWLAGQAAEAQPDLIVGGPVYRMYHGGDGSKDMGGRDKASQVVTALDRLRDRYNCALVMEAHPPKNSLSLSPHGSAVWEWWPEFGVGLQPMPDGADQVEWKHWRYPRDDRTWPSVLHRGGRWGWRAGYGEGAEP